MPKKPAKSVVSQLPVPATTGQETKDEKVEVVAAAAVESVATPPTAQPTPTPTANRLDDCENTTFLAEWDEKGVCFYQAFNDKIADWAVEHQKFGGPDFGTSRMTWIKPSFAWVLYRSGYGSKHSQTRILKVKISHEAVAELLQNCQCREGGGGSKGRVQWDPARDIMTTEGRVPRRMLRRRAIQIGLAGTLSELYVRSAISIEDVTELAHLVGRIHQSGGKGNKVEAAMEELVPLLPVERPYLPRLPLEVLARLKMA